MKYIQQLLIILVFSFLGEVLHKLIPLPIPAGIYGIALLFACLELKLVSVRSIKDISIFLIEIMPIMFIPAAIGIMDVWDLVKVNWLAYLLISIITTVIVMSVSGQVTQVLIRIGKKGKHE